MVQDSSEPLFTNAGVSITHPGVHKGTEELGAPLDLVKVMFLSPQGGRHKASWEL